MTVQMTTSSARDFFQAQPGLKVEAPEHGGAEAASDGRPKPAFASVLSSMEDGPGRKGARSSRKNASLEAVLRPGAVSGGANALMTLFPVNPASAPEWGALDLEALRAGVNQDAPGAGHFDPDLILGELYRDGAPAPDVDLCDAPAVPGGDAPDECAPPDGMPKRFYAPEQAAAGVPQPADASMPPYGDGPGGALPAGESLSPEDAPDTLNTLNTLNIADSGAVIPAGSAQAGGGVPAEQESAGGPSLMPGIPVDEEASRGLSDAGMTLNAMEDSEAGQMEADGVGGAPHTADGRVERLMNGGGHSEGESSGDRENIAPPERREKPQQRAGVRAAYVSDESEGRTQSSEGADKAAPFSSILAGARGDALDASPGSVRAQAHVLTQPGDSYALSPEDAFGDGLTEVLEFMRGDDASEARIVVEPPALGRIDVSLNSDSRGVEATFKVDNEYLKQMLQNQLDALKTSLQAQGIHVSGLAVDIKNRDDQRGRGDLHGAKGRTRRSAGLDAASDETRDNARLMRLDLERGILHWVA